MIVTVVLDTSIYKEQRKCLFAKRKREYLLSDWVARVINRIGAMGVLARRESVIVVTRLGEPSAFSLMAAAYI